MPFRVIKCSLHNPCAQVYLPHISNWQIIFVIIGYHFGRLPSQQNENTLKGEINRQTQKADAAQHNKESAQQAREALEEKVKNARATLASAVPWMAAKGFAESADKAGTPVTDEALRHSVIAAMSVLNS